MRTVQEFPCQVEETEHLWITMSDGVRLAARLWLPADAASHPVPAVLEYIPYRKRDLMRHRDSVTHRYLAGHGYACIRVDHRGSGDSEGVLVDQYRQQELDDAVEVIDWLTRQPWCTGRVGMMGLSWGGFNALQVAAMNPPGLAAVVADAATHDLYVDNMHYMGGCLLTDNLSEATTMFSVNSCPPDPELVGERWREMWHERLEANRPWLLTWLSHQRRDDYWSQGSVCENYDAIRCPVMAVGGWADGYTNAVFKLLENLSVPRLGLVGPWGHKYPHTGIPGPAIGFLQELVRWWDEWLKDRDTGIMEEPRLRAWMQDSVPPTTFYHERPGRWVGEETWPSARIEARRFPLTEHAIELDPARRSPAGGSRSIQSPLSVGLFAGKWASYAAAPDLPHDQREEDGGALVFESEALTDTTEILGAPVLDLTLAASQPVAMVAVRLSDVAPDDQATRVTYGLLNLTHRDGHQSPQPLEPGERYRVQVPLNHVSHAFPPGNRLRLSISTSYWALAWPPPVSVRLEVHPAQTSLVLPVRPPKDDDARIGFGLPEGAPGEVVSVLEPAHHNWLVHRDLARDESTLEIIKDEGVQRFEAIDLAVGDRTWDWYTYRTNDFSTARGETRTERSFQRGGWTVRTRTRTVLTADRDSFHVRAELDAWENGERVFSRNWRRVIPRDLV